MPALLAELRLFEVDLDPLECNTLERMTYILWCGISGAIVALGFVLLQRNLAGKGTPFRRLFRLTVVVPACVYAPVFLGFMSACVDQAKTQEEGLCIALIVIEPLAMLVDVGDMACGWCIEGVVRLWKGWVTGRLPIGSVRKPGWWNSPMPCVSSARPVWPTSCLS